MKYVFFTFTLDGVTGGQRYVNNKTKWLEDKGYDVIVFDHRGGLSLNGDVVLDRLINFQDNRFLELFFPPRYFTKKQRELIINKICNKIGKADDYVVESNSGRLALWGELVSIRLNAKHIILDVGEHPDIRSDEEYQYYSFKFERNELYLISSKIVKTFFSGYRQISDKEADEHMYSAIMNVVPEEVPCPELDQLPLSDYNILSFGREKPYFVNMINGVSEFANKHKDKRINFIIMGVNSLSQHYLNCLNKLENLSYIIIPLKHIIPKVIFRYADAVIATAGCASISYKEGAKTISMNVETNYPLGVMGYTTINNVVDNNNENNDVSLSSFLKRVLVDKEFEGPYILEREETTKGYDFQISLINNNRKYWCRVDEIVVDSGFRRYLITVFLRIGAIKLLAWLYNTKLAKLLSINV